MNSITLSGRLVADPEVRTVTFGAEEREILKFRLAVPRAYKKKDGTVPSDFFYCEASMRSTAGKFLDQYCFKGDLILVTGAVNNFSYTDEAGTERNGSVVRIRTAEILAHPKKQSESGMTEAPQPELPEENPFVQAEEYNPFE